MTKTARDTNPSPQPNPKRRKRVIRSLLSHPAGLPTGRKGCSAAWPSTSASKKIKDNSCTYSVVVDEAGLGSYAGPLVCCAVFGSDASIHVHDSKLLKEHERRSLYNKIKSSPNVITSTVFVDNEEIDRKGIRTCWAEAMGAAARNVIKILHKTAVANDKDHTGGSTCFKTNVIVDGSSHNILLGLENDPVADVVVTSLVQADRLTWEGAAAGIIAKQSRDEHMKKLSLMQKRISPLREKN